MANQILLPPQQFKLKDITDQFPATGNPKKKVFFQSELRSLSGGDATFGVIAYPAWKEKGEWVIGSKISGTDAGAAVAKPFTPVAFANNEVNFSAQLLKMEKKGKKEKASRKGRWNDLMKHSKKKCRDKKMFTETKILFEASISENPHLQYSVTLDVNGVAINVDTKPSPPAPPES